MCPKNPSQSQLWKAVTFQSTYTLLSYAGLQTPTATCRQACCRAKTQTHNCIRWKARFWAPFAHVYTHSSKTHIGACTNTQRALCIFYPPQLMRSQFALIEKRTNAEVKKKKCIFMEKKARRSNTHIREKGREDTHAQTLQLAVLQHLPI